MANVHRIGDYNQNDANDQNQNRQTSSSPFWGGGNNQGGGNGGGFSLPFEQSGEGDPRKETFWQMLRINVCPSLRILSFSAIMPIVLTLVYLTQLIVDHIEMEGKFLEVGHRGFFIPWMSRTLTKIRFNYEYWRLVTPIFLHLNFMHWLFNSVSLLIWGSFLEGYIQWLRMAGLFILSGISGNCFALCFVSAETVSIGASTAIFGIFGGMAAFLLLNWWKLPREVRGWFICIVAFIIIMNFLFGMGNAFGGKGKSKGSTDILGHVGGLLGGIFAGCFICEIPNTMNDGRKWEKVIKLIGVITFSLYLTLCVLGFLVFKPVQGPE